MGPRVEEFESYLLDAKIRTGNHPLLNMAAANAIAESDPAGNRKLAKNKSTQKIDPIVAALMALYAVAHPPVESWDVQAVIG
jgi:phage terminase large subunit-like protein